MVPLRRLRPSDRNARTHSKKQIGQVAASMKRFGVINPLIIDSNGQVVAGHARLEAAKLLGLSAVPVIRVTNLSPTELRAYMLADNKIALGAGWDRELLALELEDLQIALPDIGLDIDITGFDPGDVDAIMTDFTRPVRPNYHCSGLANGRRSHDGFCSRSRNANRVKSWRAVERLVAAVAPTAETRNDTPRSPRGLARFSFSARAIHRFKQRRFNFCGFV